MADGNDCRPAVVLMHGRLGESVGELLVTAARRAAALDVLATLAATGRFGATYVITDDPALATALAGWAVTVEPSGPDFHFGARLARLVAAHQLERVLYVGAGSGALTPPAEWAALADLLVAGPVVAANNFLSADYVAFAPGSALACIEPPPTDNDLPWRLARAGGLPKVARPRHLGSEVDIDTPTDVALLTLAPALPPRLATVVRAGSAATPALARALAALADPEARLLVAGRVSAAAWSQLESATQRYTRLISEERGMRASGRLERGEVRSLLGALLEQAGPARFFALLDEMCDVALLDSRLLFAHLRLSPSAADRFASDQGRVDAIIDPAVRALTAAATTARAAVLLGGHSLVSGGLWLLAHHLREQRHA
ncbi:MAG: hypothetical protein IT340_09675 [Chloroflexi bacterium]|nr:hypothetical protein [Chloroflexota bacterium]